jgi:FkbM family methyltransferase
VLIPVSELQSDYNVSANGVLHVGAHKGEEADQYEGVSWTPVTWIEAQPDLAQDLQEKLDSRVHKIINAAVFDKNDIELSLHISSNSQSSSLLEFGTHKLDYPEITINKDLTVTTKRIDALIDEMHMPNFINLDIQGVELKALEGLGTLIRYVKYIYTEVNRLNVYENCANIHDIDDFLKLHGFRRATTRWQWLEGWGDALYVRSEEPSRSRTQRFRSFLRLIYFYKPQAKQIFRSMLLNPSAFFYGKSKDLHR